MKTYITLTLAILACFCTENNAQLSTSCQNDIVFVVDTSDITRQENIFGFIRGALIQLAGDQSVINGNYRFYVVSMNDNQATSIPFNNNAAISQGNLVNWQQLGGGLLIGNGLNRAQQLLTSINRRPNPNSKKIAVVISVGSSRGQSLPLQSEILALQRAADVVYTVGVFTSSVRRYNPAELRSIASSSQQFRESQIFTIQSTLTTIAGENCQSIVQPPTNGPVTNNNACDNCKVENGVGFMPFRDERNNLVGYRYIKCSPKPLGGFLSQILDCGDSLFWNQDALTCVRFPSSDIYNGECDRGTPFAWESRNTCGAYFECEGSSEIKTKCCPANTGFDAQQKRCIPMQCKDNCQNLGRAAACPNKEVFRLSTGVINSCKYIVKVGETRFTMLCGAGTRWNQDQCLCLTEGSDIPCPTEFVAGAPLTECDAELHVDFENNAIKDNVKGSSIRNAGGVFATSAGGQGSGQFNGANRQRLSFDAYTNQDFKLPLAMKIRYNEDKQQSKMSLVSTGDCIDEPSLYILGGNGEVVLGIKTSAGQLIETNPVRSLPGQGQWKEVVFLYDGFQLTGEVRLLDSSGRVLSKQTIPAKTTGSGVETRIERVGGALQLGYSHNRGFPGYSGLISDFQLWRGCKQLAANF